MKKFAFLCAVISVTLLFSGFSACMSVAERFAGLLEPGSETEYSTDKEKVETTEVMYNGYLGLKVTIPAGSYKAYQNDVNLTKRPEESELRSSLDLYDYEDGGYLIELVDIENEPDSSYDDHAMLSLYADYYPDVYFDEYLEMFAHYVDRSDDYSTYELIEQTPQDINDKTYERFLVYVSGEDSAPYYEEHYVTQANGCFFVAYINYWSDNEKSKSDAYEILNKCFTLESAGIGQPI